MTHCNAVRGGVCSNSKMGFNGGSPEADPDDENGIDCEVEATPICQVRDITLSEEEARCVLSEAEGGPAQKGSFEREFAAEEPSDKRPSEEKPQSPMVMWTSEEESPNEPSDKVNVLYKVESCAYIVE